MKDEALLKRIVLNPRIMNGKPVICDLFLRHTKSWRRE